MRGHGFFHGCDVTVRFLPAEPGRGVVFQRVDLPGRPSVPARIDRVVPAARRTMIRQGDATVEMTEHVLAALAGMRIDNCIAQIDAPECPGCDGSSRAFVEAFEQAGIVEQDQMRQVLELDSSVVVREGGASLAANPGATGSLTLAYHLDYGPEAPIPAHSLAGWGSFLQRRSSERLLPAARSSPRERRALFAPRASVCGRPRLIS